VSVVDLVALGLVVLLAVGGFRRGLLTGVFSLVGLVAGAVIGARIAPTLVGDGEARWAPLVAVGGAVVMATVGQTAGTLAGRWTRRVVAVGPLRPLDSVGGLVLGAVTGLALCWAVGALLLYVPGQTELRRHVEESAILATLNRELPPDRVIDVVGRVDAFAAIAGPTANVDPPDPAVLADDDVELARDSVVRITGTACGIGVEGSGWIAASGVVVTAAHVVAGVVRPVVDRGDGRGFEGRVVAFDAENDVAVVHVPALRGLALELAAAEPGTAGALLGYPENRGYAATPVRIGATRSLVGRDAYGNFPTTRHVTAVRGEIRSGNSGGPVVDEAGRVLTTVFGERTGPGTGGGYGVPNGYVQRALLAAAQGRPLSTPCL
jgi:S1-C subfamily serine protease